MQQSESIQNIAKALITFHVKVGSIKKDAKNPFFKSSYASLSNILDSINDPLIESGLSIVQFPTGANGLTSILMHDSGEWIRYEYEMKPVKDDPQGRGSCLTYQRRYALAAILSLNIDEDDDANMATHGKQSPADNNKPWLNRQSVEYLAAVKKLSAKETTIDKILQHYRLSREVREYFETL